jgi:hypothetical protein
LARSGQVRGRHRANLMAAATPSPWIVVPVLWESEVQHAGQEDRTTMKRHRHTPEQIVRKPDEG